MYLPTRPSASGCRATASIILPKMYPMPTPAPANPAAANPIPNSAADAASIQRSPFLSPFTRIVRALGMSVQGDGVSEIHAGQNRKNVGLNKCDEHFQSRYRDRERKRKPADKHGQREHHAEDDYQKR